MGKMTPLQQIREAVKKAAPEVFNERWYFRIEHDEISNVSYSESLSVDWIKKHNYQEVRPIRLADVLAVLKGALDDEMYWHAIDSLLYDTTGENWNLRDDDLDHQSEETLTFLASLMK